MHIFFFGHKTQLLLVLGFTWTMATDSNKTCLSIYGHIYLYTYIITIDIYSCFLDLETCPYEEMYGISQLPPGIRKACTPHSSWDNSRSNIICKGHAKLDLKEEKVLFPNKTCSYRSEQCTIEVFGHNRSIHWVSNYDSCKDLELLYNGTAFVPNREKTKVGNILKRHIIIPLHEKQVLLNYSNVNYNHCVNISATMTQIKGVIFSKKNITTVIKSSDILKYNFTNYPYTPMCKSEINRTVIGEKDNELMRKLFDLEKDLADNTDDINSLEEEMLFLSIVSAVCVTYFIIASIASVVINFSAITRTKVKQKLTRKKHFLCSLLQSLTTFYLHFVEDGPKKSKKKTVDNQGNTYASTDHLYEAV